MKTFDVYAHHPYADIGKKESPTLCAEGESRSGRGPAREHQYVAESSCRSYYGPKHLWITEYGYDHLDTGSVASPFRETEGMVDGSDAIADWPLLNALVNTAAGASWISIHNGGGVGIGYSQHAGMVVVADGTDSARRRLERVLTSDPGWA